MISTLYGNRKQRKLPVKKAVIWPRSVLFIGLVDATESPNRDNDHYEHYIESKYCSIKQSGMHFDKAKKQNGFSVLYCNMDS